MQSGRVDEETSPSKSVAPEAAAALEGKLRRLVHDNEDLRFECARLRTSLDIAQRQILDLTERTTTLQSKLDRIYRLAPRGSLAILRWIGARLDR